MKSNFLKAVLTVMVFSVISLSGVKADPFTVTFPVLGNCYLCKLRIEQAVNQLDGIYQVEWDYNTLVTTVVYDDEITDPFIVMDAIAMVGHDTEWYPAPDSSYATLIGTCCEYLRTNDYTNVQVGYLSLMDLWVYPVGLEENDEPASIAVFPTAVTNYFNISIEDGSFHKSYEVSIFGPNGTLVHASNTGNGSSRIDLGYLSSGQYIIIVTNNNRVVHRSKIIKL